MKKLLAIFFAFCLILSNVAFAAVDDSILCDFGTLQNGDIGVGAVYAGPVYDMDKYGFATFTIDFEQTGSYDIYLTCRTQHAVLDIMQDYRVVSTKEITRDHATHEIAWANPAEEKIGTVNIYKTGNSLVGFDVVSVDVTIGVDSMRLVRTGDAPKKLSWYATDTADYPQEAAYNKWCGGYGMYSPLAIGFPVDFEENGNYEIYASLGARDATLDINVDGELALTYRVTSDHDTDENSWLNPSEYLLGSINILEAGEHNIRFVVKEAHNSILFRQFYLVRVGDPLPPQILPQKIEFEDYNTGGQNVGYYDTTPGVVPAWCIDRGDDVEYGKGGSGYLVSFGAGEWMKYDVDAKKAGRYEVIVSYAMTDMSDVTISLENGDNKACEKKLYPTGDWSTYFEKSIGVVSLSEGINTLKFAMVQREMNVDYFILKPISDKPLAETVMMGNTNILEAETVPCGADSIVITFTEEVNLEENSVELYEGNTLIPAEITAEGNVVTVALKQCLLPSETYEFHLCNITSALDGTAMEDAVLEFITGTDTAHSGSIKEAKAIIENGNTIKITGIAKSSLDLGIKGRELTLYLDSEKVAETVSADNGVFSFVYAIPPEVSTKQYEFRISSGNTESAASVLYVSDALMKEIAKIFTDAETKEDIKTACETFCDKLALSYSTDLTKVADADEFHTYFLGKEYKTEDDVIDVYNVALGLGTIKAALSIEDVNKVLSQDRFVLPMDISENYYLSERSEMLSEIFEARSESYDNLNKAIKEAVRKAYLLQCGRKDSQTVSQKTEFESDEMVVINLGYTEKIKDVKKVTFIYKGEDLDDFESLSVETEKGINSKTTQKENEIIIEFTFDGEVKDFGKLKFSAGLGAYSLKEFSEITYSEKSYPFDSVGKSAEKDIEFTVKEAKKSTSSSSGGRVSSSGEGFGGGKGSHITMNPQSDNVVQPAEQGFKDLTQASWAEDYINSLYENGILSMPEDRNFRPNDYVTREEFLKMIVEAFEFYDETAETDLSDVAKDSWYYKYIASGQKCGIIMGNEQNRFDVGKQITREDMSVMIARILSKLGYTAGNTEEFADGAEIASYAKDAVSLVKYLEIVNGMGDGMFAPKAQTTRAQAAKVICKAMEVVGR